MNQVDALCAGVEIGASDFEHRETALLLNALEFKPHDGE